MNIRLLPVITAGALISGTAVSVLAIPGALPIDYRSGGVPAGSSATGIGGGTATQTIEGLGVNSAGFAPFDDNGEVGPGETLSVQLNTSVTGVWLLQLFDEVDFFGRPAVDAGSVELFDAGNVSLGLFGFNGAGNPPRPGGNGEEFVDFGGPKFVHHAVFSTPDTDQISNKDYSVAGFTRADASNRFGA
jgi:hypothetical protein